MIVLRVRLLQLVPRGLGADREVLVVLLWERAEGHRHQGYMFLLSLEVLVFV